MRPRLNVAALAALAFAVPLGSAALSAPSARSVDATLYAELRWRNIGPFRGGRAVAVSGVAGDPRTFYFGSVGGGVWKTTSAGAAWKPVFDEEPVASIGAIAVAPSDPNTVYVGSGEADMRSDIIHGNGMYRSTDAGAHWTRIGLEDSRQIGRILVDPQDPKTLLVAALGHAYGPNDMRGVYRSTDGGANWTRTLFHDRDTGAIDLASDPSMRTVYASLWQTRRPPWSVYPPSNGPGTGLYKSTDGGVTWNHLTGHGFPADDLGKIGLAVAPSEPNRVYAIVDAKDGGLYRSDDGGASWTPMSKDKRIWERGWYFCHVTVDPKNPDVVYVADTAMYRSSDGGKTFTAIKGSPDGDDFQGLWIDPTDPARMALSSDQGASVSLDRGETWSSWFNQPTGQFYHVITDDAFPYFVYGAQQDSGADMEPSATKYLTISQQDFRPLDVGGENGYLAPDPRHPGLVYGGVVTREIPVTGWEQNIDPTLDEPETIWRNTWTLPLAFSPADRRSLYFGHQKIFRSRDGGETWKIISPDLSREDEGTPSNLDPPTAADDNNIKRHGVVYAIAPSPLRGGEV